MTAIAPHHADKSDPADSVSGVLDGLRAEPDAVGLTRFDIQLPGEDSAVAPLEGALRVRADGMRFVLETVDYGEALRLLSADSEAEIKHAAIGYVSRPPPPLRPMSRHELDSHRRQGRGALLRPARSCPGSWAARHSDRFAPDADRQDRSARRRTYLPDRHSLWSSAHCRQPHCAPRTTFLKFLTTADLRVRAATLTPWFGRPRWWPAFHPATARNRPAGSRGLGAIAAPSDLCA